MGSGKSTLGKKLAALSRRPFTDLDHYIEDREKKKISAIFKEEGEAAFREKETHYLGELIKNSENSVIALGGGTVCFADNLELVKQHGLLVYLELPATVLADRIEHSKKERPLLSGLRGQELRDAIEQRLQQRLPFYTQAHLTISGLSLTPVILQQAIARVQK